MSTNAADNLHPITELWWLFVLFGVLTLGVGVFFVVSPHETLSTFTVIAGIFLLVDGVLAIFASIFSKGDGRGLLAIIGVLSALAGLVLIKKPFDTLVVFTLIVGAWFVVAGIVRFVAALASPEGRGGNIVTAILDVIAGIVILSWPDLGLSTLAVIIGIVLILRGVFFIVSGWQLRKLNDDLPGSPTAHAQAEYALGLSFEATDRAQALRLLDRSVQHAEAVDNRWIRSFALTESLWIRARSGQASEALRGYHTVIDTWFRGGDWANQWLSLRYVFAIFESLEHDEVAATLHGALEIAGAMRALPMGPGTVDELGRAVDRLTKRLGTSEFAEAAERGRRMRDEEVVRYALAAITSATEAEPA